jgi:hypothetical protein
MSYQSIVEMAGSTSLIGRIAAAAADEGQPDALQWAQTNVWVVVAADAGWSDAWDYARDNSTLDNNPDTGARPGVINDAMILAVVQPLVTP